MTDTILIRPEFDMVLLLITNTCNLECRHCYVSSGPKGEYGLSVMRLKGLVDEIVQSLGPVCLALSGGEPLARANDALEILEYASGRLDLLLLTNGTLINRTVAKRLVSLPLRVRIGLDGPNEIVHDRIRGRGSFRRTLVGIERLLEAGFPPDKLEFFMTVPDEHVSYVSEVIRLAEKLGVRRLKLEPPAKTGRAAASWPHENFSSDDLNTRVYRQTFTPGGIDEQWDLNLIDDTKFQTLNIYYDGSVYPWTFQDQTDRELGYLGNVRNSSLMEILDDQKLSSAVLSKYIMLVRGPVRSLRALRVVRRDQS